MSALLSGVPLGPSAMTARNTIVSPGKKTDCATHGTPCTPGRPTPDVTTSAKTRYVRSPAVAAGEFAFGNAWDAGEGPCCAAATPLSNKTMSARTARLLPFMRTRDSPTGRYPLPTFFLLTIALNGAQPSEMTRHASQLT